MNEKRPNTLSDELSELRSSVERFLGSQLTWNDKHDQHSHEVLESINKNIQKLFEANEVLIKSFGNLNCKEHSTRIDLSRLVTEEKVSSVEKRVNWLWAVLGLGAATTILKSVYSFIKG